MESLDLARAREARRLSRSVIDPVVVHNIHDIKRIVGELDPNKNPKSRDIEVKTHVESEGQTFEVRANTKSKSKRDMLVEGLDVIKRRIETINSDDGEEVEINGVAMRPNHLGSGAEGRSWVDPLITQWTGGFRDGIYICWDLDGYRYKYNIYEHKLTRIKNGTETAPTSSV